MVEAILTNPKYIGYSIYNRTSLKLKQKRVRNPPETWVVRPDAFTPIVSKDVFAKAQEIRKNRRDASGARILEKCRALLATHGRLSLSLIRKARISSPEAIQRRFGTLERLYKLVGYQPKKYNFFERYHRYKELHLAACESVIKGLQESGVTVSDRSPNGLLMLNNEYTVFVTVVPCYDGKGKCNWDLRKKERVTADLTIVVRLARGNREINDYYLIPAAERPLALKTSLKGRSYRLYRCNSLDAFFSMMRHIPIDGMREFN